MKRRWMSLLLILAWTASLFPISGCGKQEDTVMTRGDALNTICDEFGMYDYQQETPYFDSVPEDDPYFASVQKCVEWSIISAEDPAFDVHEPVTRGELAELVINAGNLFDQDGSLDDKLAYAAAAQLVAVEKNGEIAEKETVTEEEIKASVSAAQQLWANPAYEEKLTYDLREGVVDLTNATHSTYENGSLLLPPDAVSGLQEGDIYLAHDADGAVRAHRIGTFEEAEGGVLITNGGAEPEFDDVFETLQYQNSITPDFSDAQITDGSGNVLTGSSASLSGAAWRDAQATEGVHFLGASTVGADAEQMASSRKRDLNFTVDGVTVKGSISGNSVSFSVSGKITDQITLSGSYKVSDFNIDADVDYQLGDLKYARLAVGYTAEQSVKLSTSLTANSVNNKGAFGSSTDYHSALLGVIENVAYDNSVSGFNYDGTHAKGCSKTIGIARIAIPGLHYGVVGVVIEIKLIVKLDGSVELAVTANNLNGIEYKKGAGIRTIQAKNVDTDLKLQASMEGLIYLGAVASFCGFNLADVGVNAGLGCSASSVTHLADYTIAGERAIERASVETQHPGDFLSAVSSVQMGGTLKIETCSDLNAYFVLKIEAGKNSILGKFTTCSYEICGPSNAALWQKHMEDGRFVDQCTRKYRTEQEDQAAADEMNEGEKAGSTDPEQLDLGSYIVTLNGTSQKLDLVLQEGQAEPNVIWSSSDPGIASVDQTGVVSPVSTGMAVITAALKENPDIFVKCTVIVEKIGEENWEFLPSDLPGTV